MLIKRIFLVTILVLFATNTFANTPRSTGKYKNWESFTVETDKGKVCFAQTVPTKRAPSSIQRGKSKLFVTFRPSENIKDEVSLTSGHEYKSSSVVAKSGKNSFSLFSQGIFAWVLDGEEEYNLIKTMKKASKLSVTATAKNGSQTRDLYSMMGFTKAYNAAKKSCA